jgi:excisionase family DNA binding protein
MDAEPASAPAPAAPTTSAVAPLPRLTLTSGEAAQVLGISEQTVYRLMRTGEIPVVRFGRRTVIRVCDLEDLLASRAAQTQATSAAERTLLAAAKEAQQQRRYRR